MAGSDPDLLEGYKAALRPRQNVYSRVMEDFMSVPQVISITSRAYKGIAGDKIVVRAIDDFRVTSVRVEIYAANGTLLEEGDAQLNTHALDWIYTATQANSTLAGTVIKL